MSQIAEHRKIATGLSTPERAEFAAFLLGTSEQPHHWEDDSEVYRRSEELDSGAEVGLTRKEFTRVQDARRIEQGYALISEGLADRF